MTSEKQWTEPDSFPDDHTRRIQSAQVLFAFEVALGEFVKTKLCHVESIVPIVAGAISRREGIPPGDMSEVVSASYIGELIDLAIECSKGTSYQETFLRIKTIFKTLDMYDVRNAIAHPNRPFPPVYWYRVKALVADPAVVVLNFERLTESFTAAMLGKLTSPPDEWIASLRWQLQNNLPDRFDHSVTGLLGRRRERGALLKTILNDKFNLMAIVGRGGYGKTSLLLDCLEEVVNTPSSTSWVDQVIWISAKTHQLTVNGQQEISPSLTFSDVKNKIISELGTSATETFENIIQLNKNLRVLLVIDNLETLLRDAPEAFGVFYAELPKSWRLIVSSRVTVDSATTITLDVLDKEGARQLAASYLRWKGHPKFDRIDRIADAVNGNPLHIKIAIDGMCAGGELEAVLSQTRERVVEYSYDVLAQSLTALQKSILELLFASDEPISRSSISAILATSIDDLAESLRNLLKTTLLSRVSLPDGEKYELNSGVRDYILAKPLDLAFRNEIVKKQAKAAAASSEFKRIQARHDIGALDKLYIPPELSHELVVIVNQATQCLRNHSFDRKMILSVVGNLRSVAESEKCPPVINRLLGLAYLKLSDQASAMAHFVKASSIAQYDPPALELLAYHYGQQDKIDEAINCGKRLIDDGWADPKKGGEHARYIWINYWRHRSWRGEASQVASETSDWKTRSFFRFEAGLSHAQALRRSVEPCLEKGQFESLQDGLNRATQTFRELIASYGMVRSMAKELYKLIEQIAYAARAKAFVPSEESKRKYVQFVNDFLPEVLEIDQRVSLNDPEVADNLAAINIWGNVAVGATSDIQEDSTPDCAAQPVLAMVIRIPTHDDGGRATWVFATDAGKNRYFIHRSAFVGTSREWHHLSVGTQMKIIPGSDVRGKSNTVIKAWVV
jgi:tetratricopeptide (TPR) repeat protein